MSDLKSATKNCIESVKTNMQQKMKKNLFPCESSIFSQLAFSSDSAAASESLLNIDAQFYGSFYLCKVKTSRLKNFAELCQVR